MKNVKYDDVLKYKDLGYKMTVKQVKEYIEKNGEINILATCVLGCLMDHRCDFAEYNGYNFTLVYDIDDAPAGAFTEYYHIEKIKKI